MKIEKIEIKIFRGFEKIEFGLGTHITIIAGQNGTQKTTILGLLSQPFSITDKSNPMFNETPLSGGSFKSAFSDKFKLSNEFDKAGEHDWTLFFDDETPPYNVESIIRDKSTGTIRFWKKRSRVKGSGYIQLPVIYLSLKRLLPIGEDNSLKEDKVMNLTDDEFNFYKKWHDKILILTRERDQVSNASYLLSKDKQTLGANTDHYDWQANSAGQDNISKILLAILSFKRLKDKYKDHYKGGILAIDEVDITFYTGSQIKLIAALINFSEKFNIQIIFTTHSLTILEEASKLQNNANRKNQVRIMFLKKEDGKVIIKPDVDYNFIKNDLNVTLAGRPQSHKIYIYTEDREAAIFVKSLLGIKHTKHLKFIDVSLGCGNLIELASKKIPSFSFSNSIIVLDGDVKNKTKQYKKAKKIRNILLLPTDQSPEQIIGNFLYETDDSHRLWGEIDASFNHQYCFQNYSIENIRTDRVKAKEWFNSHLDKWGRNANKVLNYWKKDNKQLVEDFKQEFENLYKNIKL